MTEKTVSSSVSEDNPVKKGFSLRRLLINLLWWSLIMGIVAGICAGVVYFTEKVLGIESFLGAIIAFPAMGVLLFITLAIFTNDFDTGFTLSIALAVGGFGYWLVLRYFGGIGIGVMVTFLIILCAFTLDLTEKKGDTKPTEKPAGEVAEVKETQEQKGRVAADGSPLLGTKYTWKTTGEQISLNAADTTLIATLKEISKEAASIAFEDGTRCQATNSTMQIFIEELPGNTPILTYQRKVFGSDENIEFADGRKLGFKRHQSNILIDMAKLAWELHDGDKVLMRFEEKAGTGEIVFTEQLTGTTENYLLCLVGILAIKTFWANIAAARSV